MRHIERIGIRHSRKYRGGQLPILIGTQVRERARPPIRLHDLFGGVSGEVLRRPLRPASQGSDAGSTDPPSARSRFPDRLPWLHLPVHQPYQGKPASGTGVVCWQRGQPSSFLRALRDVHGRQAWLPLNAAGRPIGGSQGHVHADPCPAVRRRNGASRRQNVGIWQHFGRGRADGASGNRQMQEKRGAPGLDRTADTRCRKHAAGVTIDAWPDAIVLHSPRFCATSALRHVLVWSAVTRSLVGCVSAGVVARGKRRRRVAAVRGR